MNILFNKMRTGKKGQIIAMLTVALVIFVIAAFLVVNLGKNKIQDSKVANAATAGVLAGGSAACVLLNSMANINDQMILNFAGFTVMMQFMLFSWITDFVQLLGVAASTLTLYNWPSGPKLLLGVLALCLTTATMALMISGATKVGYAIKKMIDEQNDKLPKNSRDSARQYAFSNVGVDEPKIPFSKSGCADIDCYLLIETGFDVFMRETLPGLNKDKLNYGTSTINFEWDDSRNERFVNNRVDVTVLPVQKVPFRLIKFSDVFAESGAIISYLSTQKLGLLAPIIILGVLLSPIIIALIWGTVAFIAALGVYLTTLAVTAYSLAATYWGICFSCGWWFCSCCWACPMGAYYSWIAAYLTWSATIAYVASVAFFIVYNSTPPGAIPCFVWETRREHPISTTVTRTTDPPSINYGIYTTDWPVQSHSASGTVKDGSIFPPNQSFDISLDP